MALNRRPLIGAAVVLVGAALLSGIALLGPLGTSAQASVVTPSAPAQQVVCPGGLLEVGASGSASSVSSPAAAKVTVGAAGASPKTKTRRLARGGVHEGSKAGASTIGAAAAADAGGLLAAAQSQTVSGTSAAGFSAAACTTPGAVSWLVGGSTTTGRTTVLLLSNRSSVPASVDVAIWTDGGPASGAGLAGITVAARTQRAIPLASVVPNAAAIVIRVTSTGGQPAATLEQSIVRGLETGGTDTAGATAAPATTVVIPGVRVQGGAAIAAAQQASGYADLAPVVRVLAPTRSAAVTVTAAATSGTAATVRQAERLSAGHVAEVPLTGLSDGTYTITVRADAPIVAAARVSTIEPGVTVSSSGVTADTGGTDGSASSVDTSAGSAGTLDTGSRELDFAWFGSASPIGEAATTAVAAGPSALMTFANPTRHSVTANLRGALASTVTVPAGGSISVGASTGVVGIEGASGLIAAISYAGPGALAGYPVFPSSLSASTVVVTH